MFWLGKFLGGIFGYMIAGPFGSVLGIILGHYFDISRKGVWFFPPPPQQSPSYLQEVFFRTTFIVMGHISKADGRVSENAIRFATRMMNQMQLHSSLREQAMNHFRTGKQGNFNIDQLLSQLNQYYSHQRAVLQQFIEIQVQMAYADGFPSKKKEKILEYICYHLNFNPRNFFQSTYSYEHFSNRNYQHYNRQYQYTSTPDLLEKAYATLGINKETNNHDLKRTYRKLMSKNHPDKVAAMGLSDEKIKLATQKTQEIKLAYETICKARGI